MKIKDILDFLYKRQIKYSLWGDEEAEILGFCSLNQPKRECLTWIKHINTFDFTALEKVSGLTVVCAFSERALSNQINFIQVEGDLKKIFFSILEIFFPLKKYFSSGIGSNSVVLTSKIGGNVFIGNNCNIDENVTIEDNVMIYHNVSIEGKVSIGRDSIIDSGVVIGADGFGFYIQNDGNHKRVPHYGGVRIGEHVEIGANSCIDKGTIDDTIIGNHVKIDKLVHIAHNVIVEDNVMIIGGVAVGGSCRIKKGAYIAPKSVIMNQVTIGEGSFVGMCSNVIKDVPDKVKVFGNPARIIQKLD
ncbi:MAG: UDP-3-O-(3-hydroxymyristoyl)glucosamine N-acyltransferase [Peptococcaceae bacterium]|nr:UDP-3-O-(3-hydroxymyristoyl)glucosamine N-acyltransferase [Peptococcaceae bacterium]